VLNEAGVSCSRICPVSRYCAWDYCGPRAVVDVPLAVSTSALWLPILRVVGVLLIIAGAPVLLDSFARFALTGLGTPAPVFPTRHLVVSGLYQYVRNPMYLAVVSVIIGQGLLFGNVRVLDYGALVWLGFHFFVLAYEESVLRATFGTEYKAFCDHVPRWIPRLRPWRGM
jgi:protein-S-isoprenylcysteine O-methyltransferase Ste14